MQKLQRLFLIAVVVLAPIIAVLYIAPPRIPKLKATQTVVMPPARLLKSWKQPLGPHARPHTKPFVPDYIASGGYPALMGIYKPQTTTRRTKTRRTNGAPNFSNGYYHLYYDGQGYWVISSRLGEVYTRRSRLIYFYAPGSAAAVPTGLYKAQNYVVSSSNSGASISEYAPAPLPNTKTSVSSSQP